MKQYTVYLLLCGMIVTLVARCTAVAADETLSFDSPFPKSRVEGAVNASMELWGNLQFLCGAQGDELNQADRERLVKLSIGNAAYIKELAKVVRPKMSKEDSLYVAGLIDRAIRACPDTPRHQVNNDRFSFLQSLLRKAFDRFSGAPNLFKGNDTVVSTSE